MGKIVIEEGYIKMAIEHLNKIQVSGLDNMQNVIIAATLLQKGEMMEDEGKEEGTDGR